MIKDPARTLTCLPGPCALAASTLAGTEFDLDGSNGYQALVVRPRNVARKCVGREVGAEHVDGLGEHVGEQAADG